MGQLAGTAATEITVLGLSRTDALVLAVLSCQSIGYWPHLNIETKHLLRGFTKAAQHPKVPMCSRCIEIDGRIDQLRKLGGRVLDPRTLESINILVERLVAEKAALHPAPERKDP